jgi:hypothetical protein
VKTTASRVSAALTSLGMFGFSSLQKKKQEKDDP